MQSISKSYSHLHLLISCNTETFGNNKALFFSQTSELSSFFSVATGKAFEGVPIKGRMPHLCCFPWNFWGAWRISLAEHRLNTRRYRMLLTFLVVTCPNSGISHWTVGVTPALCGSMAEVLWQSEEDRLNQFQVDFLSVCRIPWALVAPLIHAKEWEAVCKCARS